MASLKLYGVPWSRASRCLWMLEGLGVEYENVPVANTRAPGHLAINPNGRIPALVDGDTAMWESLAINLYLARRFPSDLSARSQREEADVLKWSLWAQSDLEGFFEHIASLEEIPAEWYERAPRVLDERAALARGLLLRCSRRSRPRPGPPRAARGSGRRSPQG